MFKNLDGFKKVQEDKDSVTMAHAKGHTVKVLLKPLLAMHRKQLQALPLHKFKGGKIVKLANGGGDTSAMADQDIAEDTGASTQSPNQAPPAAPVDNSAAGSSSAMADQDIAEDTGAAAPSAGASGQWDSNPQQSPAPQAAQAPAAKDAGLGGLNITPQSIYGQAAAGIKGAANAQAQEANSDRLTEIEHQNKLAEEQQHWDDSSKLMQENINTAINDVKNGHINPKQYLENMGTGQKISTAIGLFLGGFSNGLTGHGNPAMDFLNKQIDRDIDAQKEGVNNKMNVYHAYLNQYHDAAVADSMARATQMQIYGSKIKEAADEAGSPMAKARAQQALAELQMKIQPLVQNANYLTQMKSIDQRAQGAGQLSQLPPEQLVQFTGASPEEQNKMLEEIKMRQNIKNIRQPLMDAFDKASKEVRPMTGGIQTSGTAFVPGMQSPAQKQWQGLANTTVKEVEGTARQAAFDSLSHNFMPQFGDSDENIKMKRAGFEHYLQAQAAAPVSNGHRLNLDNFASTTSQSNDTKVVNGVTYRRGPNGQAIRVK